MINEILLRRKQLILLSQNGESKENQKLYVATIQKNIESLGYTFSKNLFDLLCSYTIEQLKDFYLELVNLIKNMIGVKIYQPMYPNFPQSVMERSDFELYFNAIIHYWSYGTILPYEAKNERLPLFDETKVKVLDVGTEDDLKNIFINLVKSKTSISQTDKDDLSWFFKNYPEIINYLPNEIPLKENVALIGKLYLENNPLANIKQIQKYFKTATDVLRLITAMSNGDVSLSTNTKFRSFKRKERKMLLELLQNCGNIEEDMLRYKNKWIRIGERLHPFEYNYQKVNTAFRKLRNNEKIETFGGKLNVAIVKENYKDALLLLKQRPGEFARKLDHILRITDNKNAVVNTFKDVAAQVSTPVLLQVREHFKHRNNKLDIRVFFPKGNVARSYYVDNTLPEIEQEYCDSIVTICENALIENYKNRKFLGKVYLSEDFRNYLVPFSQRSASKTLKTIVRGSKLPLNKNTKALRAFIWWTNTLPSTEYYWNDGRVDIDLSAAIFDDKWNYMEHISYTNLRSHKYNACHSGDITNGGSPEGNGVSEFLDVDIDSVLRYGARYVVYQIYSYSNQTFDELPNCMFGWMEREDVKSGEIYEPKTVKQKMDLTSHSRICIPVIFDCLTREVVWCDMNISLEKCRNNYGGNNIESNFTTVSAICYSMVNLVKPNLYDLIDLNIKARGVRVDTKEEADIIFDTEDGIKPWNTEVFMGEYL